MLRDSVLNDEFKLLWQLLEASLCPLPTHLPFLCSSSGGTPVLHSASWFLPLLDQMALRSHKSQDSNALTYTILSYDTIDHTGHLLSAIFFQPCGQMPLSSK